MSGAGEGLRHTVQGQQYTGLFTLRCVGLVQHLRTCPNVLLHVRGTGHHLRRNVCQRPTTDGHRRVRLPYLAYRGKIDQCLWTDPTLNKGEAARLLPCG